MDLQSISVMSDAALSDKYLGLYRELGKYIKNRVSILGSDTYRDYLLVGKCMNARGRHVRSTIGQLCLDVMKVLPDLTCVRVYEKGGNKPMDEFRGPEVIAKVIDLHPELLYVSIPGISDTVSMWSPKDIRLISGDGTSVRFAMYLMLEPGFSSELFRVEEGR